jgi:methanogenic corrinoid protein MtbC1
MIGGAPFTQRDADEMGADGFCRSASGGAVVARKLSQLCNVNET